MAVPGVRSFFKVYFPEFYAERLELARAFCLKVKGPPLGPAWLRGPSGNVWKVEVVEEEGRRFFRGAWPDFVKDHSLQPGEFLVFQWDTGSSFDVIILDYSTCDKPSAFLASPSCVAEHSSADEVGNGGVEAGDARDLAAFVTTACEIPGKEEFGTKVPRPGVGRPRKNSPETEQSTNANGVIKGRKIFLSQRRLVQKEEIERAHKAAYSFKSSHPSVVLVMRKSAVYNGYMLSIPTIFARMHLSNVTEDMVLKDSEGRLWSVTLVAGKTGYFFSAGWRKFSIENHLEEFDACVLELVDPKTFLVNIFRVVEEITPALVRRIKK